MFAAKKILSETQSILQGATIADVPVALKLNTTIARPADQEVRLYPERRSCDE
jgi:hypothetical protein